MLRVLLRRKALRTYVWTGIAAVMLVDASIATSISLAILYFVPLIFAAVYLRRWEALLAAAASTIGRILFGQTGDPLGLAELTVDLSHELAVTLNSIVAAIGYFAVALLLAKIATQSRQIRRLDREIETDPLTRVGNRRALVRALAEHAARGMEVSVLAVDLDHFKRINDGHGHEAGDHVLQEVATRLVRCVRGFDLVARSGGEEFLVVLPGVSSAVAANIAERVRLAIRGKPIVLVDLELSITASVGVASGPASELLVAQADRALYAAKHGGRDCVRSAAA